MKPALLAAALALALPGSRPRPPPKRKAASRARSSAASPAITPATMASSARSAAASSATIMANEKEKEKAAAAAQSQHPAPAAQQSLSPLAHALLLSARSDFGSRGQRGRAATSSASARPSRSRSIPAQAIIAPLSVQSFCGGATIGRPTSAQNRASAPRIAALAADAAGDDDRLGRDAEAFAKQLQAHPHPVLDHVDDRRLKRRAKVGDVLRRSKARPARRRTAPPS